MIGRVAALDFSEMLTISNKNDMIDAISLGLNMLSEELKSNVVEKSKIDEVNSKLKKFAYTTAHDLKSPLNSLSGLINIMELTLDATKDSEVALYLDAMQKTILKMKTLVQNILEYSLTDTASIQKTHVDLNEFFNDIIETHELEKCASVTINSQAETAYMYEPAIAQVMANLLSNAVKYSDKEICQINISSTKHKDHVQICVSDNGRGIAPENQEAIFDLFNQVDRKSNKESHGIGLATVKNILGNFDERIWIESALGEGATFCFTLKNES